MVQDKKIKESDAPLLRRNRTEPVARASAGLGADIFARAGFRDSTLVLRWAEIAGAAVAQLCLPVKLSEGAGGGVLTLKAEPGASLFLQHESRALCERINTYLGRPAVIRLRFVQGPLALRPKPQRISHAPQAVHSGDAVQSFKGPEAVREALLKLARRRSRSQLAD